MIRLPVLVFLTAILCTPVAAGQDPTATELPREPGSILERFGQTASVVENRLAPVPLRTDIEVSFVASTNNLPTRIAHDPTTGDLYVITMGGDVFRIDRSSPENPFIAEAYTSADHGLSTHILGMDVAPNGDLYILSNIETNDHLQTIIKRGRRVAPGSEVREWSVLVETDQYLRSRTAFDHKASGLTISPDGEYAYWNSGSRTDHGEEHQGVREDGLTAIILRVPTSAENLHLPNDREALRSGGYLFAEGTRNHFDLAFAPNGDLFGTENAGDRDDSEEINWLREGHHYGFPWRIGSSDTPQQFPGFNRDADPFISRQATAWRFFYDDPTYPAPPEGVTFTDPVKNLGPDADRYRDPETGQVRDGSDTGVAVFTVTSHRSPLGLVFDTEQVLTGDFTGDGFFLSWTGNDSNLLNRLGDDGEDLHHLELTLNGDNYEARITRLVSNFSAPIDAELVGRDLYLVEYGSGDVWRVRLPGTNVAAETAELPDRIVLDQNYPNPFNPATRVHFELPEAGDVQLTVHDALGREVARPVDGHLSAGPHSVTLTLTNLPSGAYFYRLSTGTESVTRSMVLAK